jgi:hypothetical protein
MEKEKCLADDDRFTGKMDYVMKKYQVDPLIPTKIDPFYQGEKKPAFGLFDGQRAFDGQKDTKEKGTRRRPWRENPYEAGPNTPPETPPYPHQMKHIRREKFPINKKRFGVSQKSDEVIPYVRRSIQQNPSLLSLSGSSMKLFYDGGLGRRGNLAAMDRSQKYKTQVESS